MLELEEDAAVEEVKFLVLAEAVTVPCDAVLVPLANGGIELALVIEDVSVDVRLVVTTELVEAVSVESLVLFVGDGGAVPEGESDIGVPVEFVVVLGTVGIVSDDNVLALFGGREDPLAVEVEDVAVMLEILPELLVDDDVSDLLVLLPPVALEVELVTADAVVMLSLLLEVLEVKVGSDPEELSVETEPGRPEVVEIVLVRLILSTLFVEALCD